MGIALRLAKAGWWQGDPGKVLKAPSDEVMAAFQYENFLSEYERMTYELNKEPA
jgi:hypothetical protein